MAEEMADRILSPLVAQGGMSYGEGVTVMEHSLQAAALAEEAGEGKAVILAALLHDVGHGLEGDEEHYQRVLESGGDDRHEESGAALLRKLGLPAEVTEPVRLHVAAKRFLVATEPEGYPLSPSSLASLAVQGGAMGEEEVGRFAGEEFSREAVRVRRYDDGAKVPGAETPTLEHYRGILVAFLSSTQQ